MNDPGGLQHTAIAQLKNHSTPAAIFSSCWINTKASSSRTHQGPQNYPKYRLRVTRIPVALETPGNPLHNNSAQVFLALVIKLKLRKPSYTHTSQFSETGNTMSRSGRLKIMFSFIKQSNFIRIGKIYANRPGYVPGLLPDLPRFQSKDKIGSILRSFPVQIFRVVNDRPCLQGHGVLRILTQTEHLPATNSTPFIVRNPNFAILFQLIPSLHSHPTKIFHGFFRDHSRTLVQTSSQIKPHINISHNHSPEVLYEHEGWNKI